MYKYNNLFFYRNFLKPEIIEEFISYKENNIHVSCKSIGELISLALEYGFEENIWQMYLTLELSTNENPFSIMCEKKSPMDNSTNSFALNDIQFFYDLFNMDLRGILSENEDKFGYSISNFTNNTIYNKISKETNAVLYNLKNKLSQCNNPEEFLNILTSYYAQNGCGIFSIYSAFRVDDSFGSMSLVPIVDTEKSTFDQLIGYDMQKKELIQNTEKFIQGSGSNNVLLFGESGTGKSTSIRALLNKFSDQKLKMIELYKNQIPLFNEIISQLKNREYKFIIYMDDLSFEDYEIEYKYLKAVIEGGLEIRPKNILLYATSNRRNIIREQWSDRMEQTSDDVHSTDTMEEKRSLVSRFGVTIYFPSPNNAEFKNIIFGLAKKHNIDKPEEILLQEARRWELRHGGLSGRVAKQFIDYVKTI